MKREREKLAIIYNQGSTYNPAYSLVHTARDAIVRRMAMDPNDDRPLPVEHLLPIVVRQPRELLREGNAKHTLTIAEMISSIKIRLDWLNLTHLPMQIGISAAIPILLTLTHLEPIPSTPGNPFPNICNKALEIGVGFCLGFLVKKWAVRTEVAEETHLPRQTIRAIDLGWVVTKTGGRTEGYRRIRDHWF